MTIHPATPTPAPVPPSAQERERVQQIAEQARDREQARSMQRRGVLGCGPRLRNLDAAAACHCSCHPQPATPQLHDGGLTCPCQLTADERRDRMAAALDLLASLGDWQEEARWEEQTLATAQQAAAEMGAHVTHAGGAAPFVIRGTVDGRAFYLRERHDRYRVVIAPDTDPGRDPWLPTPDGADVDLLAASGEVGDLSAEDGRFDPARAARVAVIAVRTALRMRTCRHDQAPVGAWFCPDCSSQLPAAGRNPV